MSVSKEREKKHLNSTRKSTDLHIIEPPKSLFVVVNNYRQQETTFVSQEKEIDELMTSDQQSLPPQPSGYLKFPEYDWF